ncbi:hypothetical protein QJS10_CPA05g00195 [Acorus calamus]|uniref:Protein FAM32A-like n=1 Tax=Acorus calamus TaxID=4465 RepID=A0AAV9EQV1_ACOCL|nr:hypothetical protein QJS10_CPA05g00195 [Acorus calamus]
MSAYDHVVGGKLKLKGKALDVKAGGVKKKKKSKNHYEEISQIAVKEGENTGTSVEEPTGDTNEIEKLGDEEKRRPSHEDHLTPAERRYIEQKEKIDVRRMAKTADKSHRDRIQGFNEYLANLSEHYDIPKVGPG